MDDSVDEQRDCEFCQGSYKSKKILLEHVRGIHKEWILEYVKYYYLLNKILC